jgi:hypothetical protein
VRRILRGESRGRARDPPSKITNAPRRASNIQSRDEEVDMAWTQKETEELYAKVQRKAMLNQDFRRLLISNPNKAITQVAGVDLPSGLKIKVIEKDPAYDMTFVLPDLVSGEMSDEELESAAGGISVLLIISACAGAIGTNSCGADACAGKIGAGK